VSERPELGWHDVETALFEFVTSGEISADVALGFAGLLFDRASARQRVQHMDAMQRLLEQAARRERGA
jgi:hypothetical protein